MNRRNRNMNKRKLRTKEDLTSRSVEVEVFNKNLDRTIEEDREVDRDKKEEFLAVNLSKKICKES